MLWKLLSRVLGKVPRPARTWKLFPGDPAPAWSALDQHGKTVSSAQLAGRRYVLWFYPKASTPGCTLQGCGFRDHFRDYQAQGIEVLGISFDGVDAIRAFAEAQGFPFRLLSDPDRTIGLAFGACTTREANYADRVTFVVGPDGRIERTIDTRDPAGQAAALLDAR